MAHQTRPLIGINVDYHAANKRGGLAHARLNAGYFDAVRTAGGLPILMPPLAKEPEIEAFLDHVEGFVLTGGLDMDPRKIGMAPHMAIKAMAERRDENDRLLLRCLLQREMPILAIGLGMQQLNIALGGTIHAHLPHDLPRAMPHFDNANEGPHRHSVTLLANTRLEDIYGGGELLVNSEHHQAVAQVAPKCRVAATAPDGVIEAIEVNDPGWFCVGVQWHPEASCASALDMQLFECFLQACIRQSQTQPLALAA